MEAPKTIIYVSDYPRGCELQLQKMYCRYFAAIHHCIDIRIMENETFDDLLNTLNPGDTLLVYTVLVFDNQIIPINGKLDRLVNIGDLEFWSVCEPMRLRPTSTDKMIRWISTELSLYKHNNIIQLQNIAQQAHQQQGN